MSKRDDIAHRVLGKINAADAAVPASPARPARGMNTFIGQVGAQMTQGFAARVEALELERANGLVVLKLDPTHVRFSKLANRDERSLNIADADFLALKDDLRANGQEFPIKVKAIEGDAGHDYEVIAGHRRLMACRQLHEELGDFPVYAILDSQAGELKAHALKMYRENAIRKDLSAYETGKMFRGWLDAGFYPNQKVLAESLKLAPSMIGYYLAAADLPAAIIEAFGDPRAVSVRWIQNLLAGLKDHRKPMLEAAAKLAQLDPRPDADEIYRQLLESASREPEKAAKPAKRPQAVKTETVKLSGSTLYKIAPRGNGLQITFGGKLDPAIAQAAQEEVKATLTRFLSKALKVDES